MAMLNHVLEEANKEMVAGLCVRVVWVVGVAMLRNDSLNTDVS